MLFLPILCPHKGNAFLYRIHYGNDALSGLMTVYGNGESTEER